MALSDWDPLTAVDQLRRLLGKPFDVAGLGPRETPFECVYSEGGMTLRRYKSRRAPKGPILPIVPASINAAYIRNATPSVSVVQRCIEGNCRVYLVKWARPDSSGPNLGLDDYAGRLLVKCLDVIRAETIEQSVLLTGHSLGGTFAAICAALH